MLWGEKPEQPQLLAYACQSKLMFTGYRIVFSEKLQYIPRISCSVAANRVCGMIKISDTRSSDSQTTNTGR